MSEVSKQEGYLTFLSQGLPALNATHSTAMISSLGNVGHPFTVAKERYIGLEYTCGIYKLPSRLCVQCYQQGHTFKETGSGGFDPKLVAQKALLTGSTQSSYTVLNLFQSALKSRDFASGLER